MITHGLLRQAEALSAQGKRVTVLTPGPRDLAAMGINLIDRRRREAVLELSLRTSAMRSARARPGKPSFATAWRCRGMATGFPPPSAGCGSQAAGVFAVIGERVQSGAGVPPEESRTTILQNP